MVGVALPPKRVDPLGAVPVRFPANGPASRPSLATKDAMMRLFLRMSR